MLSRVIEAYDDLTTAPTEEPLDAATLKTALRITTASEDSLVDGWIAAARQVFEGETGRAVITQTWTRTLDGFPAQTEIELPYPPLQSVTSIKYDDGSGVEQTLNSSLYRVIAPQGVYARRGRVALYADGTWPATAYQPKSVRMEFVAGYGDDAAATPDVVKSMLMLLAGNFYKFREEVYEGERSGVLMALPLGAQTLMRTFKYTAMETLPPRGWGRW